MPRHSTPTDQLDPIERASRDEITALQLRRLQATLRTVYSNVHTTARCLMPLACIRTI